MSFCIYITHPQVQMDLAVPVPEWGLSDLGRARAILATSLPWAKDIRHVVSSNERKAIETAEIFAEAFGLGVRRIDAMHENDRSATGFLPPDEFEQVADQFFRNPEERVRGWERAVDAQGRIVEEVQNCLAGIPDQEPVLFAGHGGVGTLLRCHLMGAPIDRSHDQLAGGGCWYRFEKSWLQGKNAPALDWTAL
ncbi:histidine phosphatase family protein [Roseibium sp.]|uniref:histidine phosphatase family protein n=1 Tax=Roseibium sp. TaxID=1936156 RepID=UPI003A96E1C1